MLTKDLVRHKFREENVIPDFIDPADESFLSAANALLDVFNNSPGKTREALQAKAANIIDGSPIEAIISRGLEKLLLDRTEFDTAPNEELMRLRSDVFEFTASLLTADQPESESNYHDKLRQKFQQAPEALAELIYSDLPMQQPVVHFKGITAERLLHRYNAAQVQGLLIHSNKLTLTIGGTDSGQIRQLFKYLRFHQLLADIQPLPNNQFKIEIDGPLNLFFQTQKYGMALARFFPALLHQETWELQAEVRFKGRNTYQLILDHTCGIEPYSQQFLSYVPEEISLFRETISKRLPDWQVEASSGFVRLRGEFYCFPDITLIHNSGALAELELFHPWHASHLEKRLDILDESLDFELILGVSRRLLKNDAVQERLDTSPYFQQYGFLFREMPTVDKLRPVLDRILAEDSE